MLKAKLEALHTRWKRLSERLNALNQQRDLETRAEERLRLEPLIAETETQRQEVETAIEEIEAKLHVGNAPTHRHPTPPSPTPPPPAPATPPTGPVEVFYSYAHDDEALRDQLDNHLKILQRQHIITSWHDRDIAAGTAWEDQIDTHLETAGIILLLISPDFIASHYCWDKELKRAMERHEAGEACVIPIILQPVDWTGAPFGKLQALPRDASAVTEWPNRDTAFTNIAKGIRAAAQGMASRD